MEDKLNLLIQEIFKEANISYDEHQALKIRKLVSDYCIEKDWDLYNEYN